MSVQRNTTEYKKDRMNKISDDRTFQYCTVEENLDDKRKITESGTNELKKNSKTRVEKVLDVFRKNHHMQKPSTKGKSKKNKLNKNDSDEIFNKRLSVEANKLFEDERLLDAACLLRKINPTSLLTDEERQRIQIADEFSSFFSVLKNFDGILSSLESSSWKSLNVSKINGYFTDCYYNIQRKKDSTSVKLDMKISSIVHKSLVPYLLAVLNETDLFYQWMPQWNIPKVKVTRSERLQQTGRCSQVLLFTLQLPWPLNFVEIVLDAVAIDDIKSSKSIGIRFQTLKSGDKDGLIPPPEPKANRLDSNGGFMIHIPSEELMNRAQDGGFIKKNENPDDFLQYTFLTKLENKGFNVPEYILRFVCRVMILCGWKRFLQVAEEIRDGKRPDHAARIKKNKELYDWIDVRLDVLCS